jgi:flagellar biosynthesis/type III secretory pathway protein FliH
MKHKKFNTFEIENFMSNHLVYKYDGYEDDDDDDDDDESNVSMVTEDNQEHENILLNQSANINANTGNNNLITSNLREYQQTLVEQRVEEEMQEEVEERIEQEMNTELSEGYEQYYEYTFWNNEYEESSDDNSIS